MYFKILFLHNVQIYNHGNVKDVTDWKVGHAVYNKTCISHIVQ